MGADNFTGMFNRAKILFGAWHNLTDIGNYTGALSAVTTVKFFDEINIIELSSIKK
jgi:hypothetical protein